MACVSVGMCLESRTKNNKEVTLFCILVAALLGFIIVPCIIGVQYQRNIDKEAKRNTEEN